MKFLENVSATIQKYAMISDRQSVLIGLSGGPDSLSLTIALKRLFPESDLHALYVDHSLRPEETPGEIDLCARVCKELGVTFHKRTIDVKGFADKEGLNLQEAARKLRYEELDLVAIETGTDLMALGHNMDDQCETFFMRITRGSGPKGLAGIPPVRNKIIRPLIETSREDIESFLRDEGQQYASDSSNLKDIYLRNKIRSSLMPLLKELNPNILNTVSRTCEILNEEEKYFFIKVTKKLMTLISRKGDAGIELYAMPFESMDKAIARRVIRRAVEETQGLRRIGLDHVEEILELAMKGKAGDSISLPGGLTAYKKYSTFVITSTSPIELSTYIIESEGITELKEVSKVLKTSIISTEEAERITSSPSRLRLVLDADKARFPLTVRKRMSGDFFYPMGSTIRKKLQDFMVDSKVPRFERDSVPIVECEGRIAWIAGLRGDEQFKSTQETSRHLLLELL